MAKFDQMLKNARAFLTTLGKGLYKEEPLTREGCRSYAKDVFSARIRAEPPEGI